MREYLKQKTVSRRSVEGPGAIGSLRPGRRARAACIVAVEESGEEGVRGVVVGDARKAQDLDIFTEQLGEDRITEHPHHCLSALTPTATLLQ